MILPDEKKIWNTQQKPHVWPDYIPPTSNITTYRISNEEFIQDYKHQFYVDGYIRDFVIKSKKALKNDWDMRGIIDGVSGSGKSVFAQQVAYLIDPTININRVCFNPVEFQNAVVNAKRYQAIIFDESLTGLNTRRAMSNTNVVLNNFISQIRQKNLFILFVLPSFFDLDKAQAIHSTKFLFTIYTRNGKRGYWRAYNSHAKTKLYVDGKKTYSYKVNATRHGRFCKYYIIDEKEYRKKKEKTLKKYEVDVSEEKKPQVSKAEQRLLEQTNNAIEFMRGRGMTIASIGRAVGLSSSVVRDRLKKIAKEKIDDKKEIKQDTGLSVVGDALQW
jgi:hypothetical protein